MKLEARTLEVVSRNENGGGVVRMPIFTASSIDLSKTAGGGEGTLDLGTSEMAQMVANFMQYPGPVPISTSPHKEFDEMAGFAPGFIEKMFVRAGDLWAHISLIPPLFYEVVELGGWRGFSVDLFLDLELAIQEFDGWVVTGGVFTNRPATDVNFKVAASGVIPANPISNEHYGAAISAFLEVRPTAEEKKAMPDTQTAAVSADTKTEQVSLAFHNDKVKSLEGDVAAQKARVASLEGDLASVRTDRDELAKKLEGAQGDHSTLGDAKVAAEIRARSAETEVRDLKRAVTQLEGQLVERSTELNDAKRVNLGIQVSEVINDAISTQSVPPAVFDGWQNDPAGWMESKFASLESFKSHVATLSGVAPASSSGPLPSGHDPKNAGDPAKVHTEEEKAAMARYKSLGVDFTGCSTAEEAKARLEAHKAAQKTN